MHVRGVLDIFDGLDIGKGDGFRITEGDARVGGVEDTEFLERDLDGKCQTTHAALVDLGGGIEDDEEGEEESNEVGIADDTAIGDLNAQFSVASDGSGGGVLETDNSLRDAQLQLLSAVAYSNGASSGVSGLATMGIKMNNDETLTVDDSALNAALSGNSLQVQDFLQSTTNGFATNLYSVLDGLIGATTDTLSLDAQSMTQSSQSLGPQIADLQSRLAVRQQQLTAIYSQVDTTLQELPLLQAQLSQQLASF
jgi:flagellar capping protein FliD